MAISTYKVFLMKKAASSDTYTKTLNERTGLPLYYLDAIWHKPDRTLISREEFGQRMQEIFATDDWSIDGNYNRTVKMRLKECDTVILFDLPTEVCLRDSTERIGKCRSTDGVNRPVGALFCHWRRFGGTIIDKR